MKWIGILALLGTLLIGAPSLQAGGTGVAGGLPDARQERIDRIKADIGAIQEMDRPRGGYEEYLAWCSSVSSKLRRELHRAMLLVSRDNYPGAIAVLSEALIAANDSFTSEVKGSGPMTKRLVARGVELDRALEAKLPKQSLQTPATRLNFLAEYINFIIKIEADFDRAWYVPYYYDYRHRRPCDCPEFDFREFERRKIEVAELQLRFTVEKFVDRVVHHDRRRGERQWDIFPVGLSQAFLKIAELESSFAAEDIAGTTYAQQERCVIQDLVGLSEDLYKYNETSDQSSFPDDRWALVLTVREFERISSALREHRNCNERDHRRDHRD